MFSATQVAAGGNPGEYRRQVNNYGGPGSIVTAHLNSSAIYDPSTQGALIQVDGNFDLYLFDGGNSQAVAYGVVLLQSGVYYLSGDRLALSASWTVFPPLGLQESSLFEVGGGGAHPDFSATGAPMQFGYYVSNSTSGAGPTQTDSGIDNWSLDLLSAPPQGVPVLGPLAIGTLILAIGIIGGRRVWRA